MKVMQHVQWEDWEYDYKYGNTFAFMGSGKPQSSLLPLKDQLHQMVTYVRNDETPWDFE